MEYYFLNAVSASMGTCTFCDSHCGLVCDSHCGIVSTGGIVKELDAEEWRRQKLLGCIPFSRCRASSAPRRGWKSSEKAWAQNMKRPTMRFLSRLRV